MLQWFKKKPTEKKEESKEEKDNTGSEIEKDFDDQEIDDKGIDLIEEQLADLKDNKDECLTDFSKLEYPNYLDIPADKMFEMMMLLTFEPASDRIRHEEGYKSGGRICSDNKVVTKSRSAGKEIIKQIGKKILSGNLNLTKISFPIRVMVPKTALESAIHATAIFPHYINKAAYSPDHLERFKFVIVATLSSFYWTNTFLKPLNPILGETLQAQYNDGTQVFVEQICHHPPVSYFLVLGPNKMYKYYGYYLVEGRASLNSVSILSKGRRSIVFKDGQKIEYNFPNETYSGTFFGQLRQESTGSIIFRDEENDFRTTIEFGKLKKMYWIVFEFRPSDYFQSDILHQGKKISSIFGTYLGFIDIDDTRYWDYRNLTPFRFKMNENPLPSDHRLRSDLKTLRDGDLVKAQEEKEKLEQIQRNDRKLRETYAKNK